MALGEDPTSGDLGRVLRLPGFINHLETPAEVKVLEELNIRYRPEEFQTFAITTREARGLSTRAAHVPSLSAELWARFNQLRDADESGELTKAWTGEWGDGSSDSLYFLVYKLTAARFTPKEVFAIACSKRWYDRKERRATTPAEILREVATALSNLAYLRRR